MNIDVDVIVSVNENADIEVVVAKLREAGMTIKEVFNVTGTITGSVSVTNIQDVLDVVARMRLAVTVEMDAETRKK
jgi:hypothetical protein